MTLRNAVLELIGTAFLLCAIIGSGIMGARLTHDNVALTLMIDSAVTGATLTALILALAPTSGAHFNPLVTIALAARGVMNWSAVPAYVVAQVLGGILGVATANAMFGYPLLFESHTVRTGAGIWIGEAVATFGLVLLIILCVQSRSQLTAFVVGGYIAAAYWFTSSTSFANPAVTIARGFSETFAGISPSSMPAFVLFQVIGAACAVALTSWLAMVLKNVVPISVKKEHSSMLKILFVCVQNSARSQMAEAWTNQICKDFIEASSAGLEPGCLNPLAVEAMKEVGIDISLKSTQGVFDLFKTGKLFGYVITVCDESSAERCPIFPGITKRLHWSFEDPASFQGTWEEKLARTRIVRDQIRAKIDELCSEVCRPQAA